MTDACMYCRLVDTVEHTTVECLRREEFARCYLRESGSDLNTRYMHGKMIENID